MLIFSLLFLLSRFVFLNWGNVFFDSKEYIVRLSEGNLLTALITGHPPLHSGFILTFWPLFQIFKLVGLNPNMMILFGQVFLSLATVWLFYKTISLLFSGEIAWKSLWIISVIPIFWIVNEGIMMETTYLFFWMGSVYFLVRFLKERIESRFLLTVSSLFWIMSFLTHTVVIMWIPFILFLGYFVNKKRLTVVFYYGAGALLIASLLNAYLLSRSFNTSVFGGLYWLYGAKFGEHADFNFDIESVLRYFRNWILPLGFNNSWVILVISFLGVIKWFVKDKKVFWLCILWILPSMITNQWWDSLLYGRHSLIVSFAFALLAGSFLKKIGYKVLVVALLLVSLSSVSLFRNPIPYIEVAKMTSPLTGGGLFIDSHFARPQTEGQYFGQMVFVDEPGWVNEKLPDLIDSYLKYQKPVYITGNALSEPYGLFSGPYVHPLSMSYKKGFILSYLSKKYHFEKIESINDKYNLNIYQVKEYPSDYPLINRLDKSNKRIDWLDPFYVIFITLLP